MCGRYTLAVPAEQLVETFDVGPITFDFVPRFNIAPGQDAPVVARDRRGRRVGLLRWGLVPAWMDEPGSGFVNARAETVASKPSFREAFRRRRCLVPADGFFEWKRDGAGGRSGAATKQPYWIHPTGGGLVSFAGLWETWARPGREPRHTFTIVTTDANREVGAVHDRMPVVVAPADREAWLEGETAPDRLAAMLHPPPDGAFALRAVSTRVNRPVEDDPGLIEPVESA